MYQAPRAAGSRLDEALSMALAVAQSPGVYALLLGSGISRAASIPTGWEITLELIRRLATAKGEDLGVSSEEEIIAWLHEHHGIAPEYSDVVELLYPSAETRREVLRGFLEPAEDDDEAATQGREPTEAHLAIARLVKAGFIRVILTTNFDRLMERALEQCGVSPRILADDDRITGRMPLHHGDVYVIKIHGDYLDTDLRNTSGELSAYSEPMNELLEEILRSFGLILCGWSSVYDPALRGLISRTAQWKFATYWIDAREPSESQRALMEGRTAFFIAGDASDTFAQLYGQVSAVAAGQRVDPMNAMLALETGKRLLEQKNGFIRLRDLLLSETQRLRQRISPETLPWSGERGVEKPYKKRVEQYAAATETLVPLVALVAFAGDNRHEDTLMDVITQAVRIVAPVSGYSRSYEQLFYLPASLLGYAVCLGAFLGKNASLLQGVLQDIEVVSHVGTTWGPLGSQMASERVLRDPNAQELHNHGNLLAPGSEWFATALWEMLQPVFHDRGTFELAFDRLEYLLALYSARSGEGVPVGRFGYAEEGERPFTRGNLGGSAFEKWLLPGAVQKPFFRPEVLLKTNAEHTLQSLMQTVRGGFSRRW